MANCRIRTITPGGIGHVVRSSKVHRPITAFCVSLALISGCVVAAMAWRGPANAAQVGLASRPHSTDGSSAAGVVQVDTADALGGSASPGGSGTAAPQLAAPPSDGMPGLGTGGAATSSSSSASSATSASQRVVVNPSNAWAVLAGISTYDYPTHPTYGGDGDVSVFRDALLRAGWSANHIVVLTDGAATASAIRSSVNWLVAHSGPSTFSVFHYSGHVLQQNGQEFMWGVDNNFISNNEFGSAMRGLQGRAWIDIAGCESAGFDAGISSGLRFVTTSSAVNEKSYERDDWHRSVWTGLVVGEGMINRKADANGDGAVSIQEAVRWAQQQAPQMTANQRPYGPQHPYAVGGDGEWFLGPSAAPPPPPPAPAHSSGGSPPPPSSSPGQCTVGVVHCKL